MSEAVLRLDGVSRVYNEAHGKKVTVLEGASFEISEGFLATVATATILNDRFQYLVNTVSRLLFPEALSIILIFVAMIFG